MDPAGGTMPPRQQGRDQWWDHGAKSCRWDHGPPHDCGTRTPRQLGGTLAPRPKKPRQLGGTRQCDHTATTKKVGPTDATKAPCQDGGTCWWDPLVCPSTSKQSMTILFSYSTTISSVSSYFFVSKTRHL